MTQSHEKSADRERRLHRRVPVLAHATFEGERAPVPLENLSIGGLGCAVPSELPRGSQVRVRVELEDGAVLDTLGEVVRANDGSLGVRFLRLDPPALSLLLSRVASA